MSRHARNRFPQLLFSERAKQLVAPDYQDKEQEQRISDNYTKTYRLKIYREIYHYVQNCPYQHACET